MEGRDPHAGQHAGEHSEPEIVRLEGHNVAGEGAHQHHALQGNIDDARAFADDAAQCGQGQWRRLVQRRRQQPDDDVYSAPSSVAILTGGAGARRSRKIHWKSTGAAMNTMTVASTTEITSADTCVWNCMKREPLLSAPNRKAAGSIAQGLLRASSATAIASKP